MTLELKHKLRFWKLKADHINIDHWIRFVIFWMIFDACLTEESGKDNDFEKLKWFYGNETSLKTIFRNLWNKPYYLNILNDFKKLSPVEDMRPTKKGKVFVKLENINDVNEILKFIYQIRCNTFHGAKDLGSIRDNNLTRYAEVLLDKPLHKFLGLK